MVGCKNLGIAFYVLLEIIKEDFYAGVHVFGEPREGLLLRLERVEIQLSEIAVCAYGKMRA